MSIRDLIRLIQASGGSAAAGQAFSGNVNGAAAGAGMVDYLKDSWDSWSSDYSGGTLAYNAIIHLSFNLNANGRWPYIRQPLYCVANDGTDPGSTGGADVVAGEPIVPGTNNIQVRVHGGTKIVQLHRIFNGITKQWTEYGTEPNPNPISVESDIDIIANFGSTGSTSPDAYGFTLHIVSPNEALFNDDLDYSFPVTVMGNVVVDGNQAPVEWYNDSSYTSLASQNVLVRVTSGGSGPTSGSFWLRYMDNGSWVYYGQVDWYDPRAYGHF